MGLQRILQPASRSSESRTGIRGVELVTLGDALEYATSLESEVEQLRRHIHRLVTVDSMAMLQNPNVALGLASLQPAQKRLLLLCD